MNIKHKTNRLTVVVLAVLTALTMLLSVIGLAACSGAGNSDGKPMYITLNTNYVQTAYEVGDEFTSEGLVVTAYYSGGHEVVEDYQVVKPDMTTAGKKAVVVKYAGVQSQYNITVSDIATESNGNAEGYEASAPIVKYVYDDAAVAVSGAESVNGALKVTATPVNGYSVAKVSARVGGEIVYTAEGSANGVYTVPAAVLTDNAVVTVAAESAGYAEAEYKVDYYSKNGELLAAYSYEEGDLSLYQPVAQKYTVFNGWVDENGNTVAELTADMFSGESVALIADTAAVADFAIEEHISLEVTVGDFAETESEYADYKKVSTKIIIDEELAEYAVENSIDISAIGVVLANNEGKGGDVSWIKADATGKSAPWDTEDWNDIRLDTEHNDASTAYSYGYAWGNRYGSITKNFAIAEANLVNRHFTPWVAVDGTVYGGTEQAGAETEVTTQQFLGSNVTEILSKGGAYDDDSYKLFSVEFTGNNWYPVPYSWTASDSYEATGEGKTYNAAAYGQGGNSRNVEVKSKYDGTIYVTIYYTIASGNNYHTGGSAYTGTTTGLLGWQYKESNSETGMIYSEVGALTRSGNVVYKETIALPAGDTVEFMACQKVGGSASGRLVLFEIYATTVNPGDVEDGDKTNEFNVTVYYTEEDFVEIATVNGQITLQAIIDALNEQVADKTYDEGDIEKIIDVDGEEFSFDTVITQDIELHIVFKTAGDEDDIYEDVKLIVEEIDGVDSLGELSSDTVIYTDGYTTITATTSVKFTSNTYTFADGTKSTYRLQTNGAFSKGTKGIKLELPAAATINVYARASGTSSRALTFYGEDYTVITQSDAVTDTNGHIYIYTAEAAGIYYIGGTSNGFDIYAIAINYGVTDPGTTDPVEPDPPVTGDAGKASFTADGYDGSSIPSNYEVKDSDGTTLFTIVKTENSSFSLNTTDYVGSKAPDDTEFESAFEAGGANGTVTIKANAVITLTVYFTSTDSSHSNKTEQLSYTITRGDTIGATEAGANKAGGLTTPGILELKLLKDDEVVLSIGNRLVIFGISAVVREDNGDETPVVPEADLDAISGDTETDFLNGSASNEAFKVTGNKTSAKDFTINGLNKTLATGVKMESATSIKFTISVKMTLTLYVDVTDKNIKIDGVNNKTTTNEDSDIVLVIELEPGTHEITKGDTMNLWYLTLKVA